MMGGLRLGLKHIWEAWKVTARKIGTSRHGSWSSDSTGSWCFRWG